VTDIAKPAMASERQDNNRGTRLMTMFSYWVTVRAIAS
jgi:hypothetical protein